MARMPPSEELQYHQGLGFSVQGWDVGRSRGLAFRVRSFAWCKILCFPSRLGVTHAEYQMPKNSMFSFIGLGIMDSGASQTVPDEAYCFKPRAPGAT